MNLTDLTCKLQQVDPVGAKFHYTDMHPTRPDIVCRLVGDPRRLNGLCRRPELCLRPWSPTKSGRIHLVEFGITRRDAFTVYAR